MRFGKPRIRRTKTFLGGLVRLTLSKTAGRPARVSRSTSVGPRWLRWTKSRTREQLTVFGIQIPVKRDE